MTDISAGNFVSVEGHTEAGSSTLVTAALSALLIVGFPTICWMGLLELVNYAFGFGITNGLRMIVASTLVVMLGLIWGVIIVSARQRKSMLLERHLTQRYSVAAK